MFCLVCFQFVLSSSPLPPSACILGIIWFPEYKHCYTVGSLPENLSALRQLTFLTDNTLIKTLLCLYVLFPEGKERHTIYIVCNITVCVTCADICMGLPAQPVIMVTPNHSPSPHVLQGNLVMSLIPLFQGTEGSYRHNALSLNSQSGTALIIDTMAWPKTLQLFKLRSNWKVSVFPVRGKLFECSLENLGSLEHQAGA